MAIRVLLVEDNDVYRSSLELLLGLQPGLEVVGAVASGAEAADAARRLAPDVVVMDYRLPGLDGAAATRAVIERRPAPRSCASPRRRPPTSARRSCAQARSASSRRAGRSRRSPPRSARPRPVRLALVQLTRENTAIVLDSTSDFLDARDRHREHADRPALRPLRRRERSATTSTSRPRSSTSGSPPRRRCRRPRSRRPADFLAVLRGARAAGSTRIWSLHLTSKLSGTLRVGAARAAEQLGGDRVRVVDTETASLAVAMLARGDRPPARARDDRRGDRGARRAVQGRERRRLHRRDARVPAEGRADRQGAGAGGIAAQRQADPLRRGRRDRADRHACVGGRRRSRSSRSCSPRARRTGDGLRSRSRTRTPRSGSTSSPTSATKARPKATLDLVEPLGAVVGTHAGPGAVGFFWFQD